MFAAGEIERVIAQVAPDALAFAEILGDRGLALRACCLALDCLFTQGAGVNTARPEYLTWAEQAIHYAEPRRVDQCLADLALGHARYSRGQYCQGRALQREALGLARHHADPEALFSSARALISWGAPEDWSERVRLAEECANWPRKGVSVRTLAPALRWCGRVRIGQGDRPGAEELWRQVQELAERTHVATASLFVARTDLTLAIIDGHLEEPLGLVKRYVERADESGAPALGRALGVLTLLAPAQYLGRPDMWLSAYSEFAAPANLAQPGATRVQPGRPTRHFISRNTRLAAARAMCLADLGQVEEARAIVGPLLDDVVVHTDDDRPDETLVLLLQVAVVLKHAAAAKALAGRLGSVAQLSNVGTTMNMCVARHLGRDHVVLGQMVIRFTRPSAFDEKKSCCWGVAQSSTDARVQLVTARVAAQATHSPK
jgi:hypothetical protein